MMKPRQIQIKIHLAEFYTRNKEKAGEADLLVRSIVWTFVCCLYCFSLKGMFSEFDMQANRTKLICH